MERGAFEYFKICCLREHLPVSLHLGADKIVTGFDTPSTIEAKDRGL